MPNITLPNQTVNPYKKEKWGYYGELGEGANAKIRFLQTVMLGKDLPSGYSCLCKALTSIREFNVEAARGCWVFPKGDFL